MICLEIKSVVIAVVIAFVNAATVQYYATKYDHLDIELILNNRRMVNYYAACLLSRGPCPPQGLEFKRILPEALETNCMRCTDKQKAVTYRTIKRLKKEYPKVWAELQALWDPNDVFVKIFEETYKNTPQPTPGENEIILEDRFGTTPPPTKAPSKAPYPPAITPTRRPTINDIVTPSAGSYPYKPSQNGGLVPQNQVGESGGSTEDNTVKPQPFTVTMVPEVNTQPVSSGAYASPTSNNLLEVSPNSYTISAVDQTASTFSPFTNIPTIYPYPPASPISSAKFVSSSSATISPKLSVTTSSPSTAKPSPTSLTFNVPQSAQNTPQVQVASHFAPAVPTTKSPPVPIINRGPPMFNPAPIINFFRPVNSTRKYPDLITQIISSFFNNNNKPPTITLQASVSNTIPTINAQERLPNLQIRLPAITDNSQGNPVGRFVKDLTVAGGKLLETGSSIADSVLSSVKTLFTPPNRRVRRIQS